MTRATLGSLRTLGAVLRTALLAVLDALGVQHAAQNVVAHAGQILDAAAADHDHRVLLKVMAFTRYVADHLEAVGQAHLGDLTKRRVRLLRGRGVDAGANTTLLRRLLQRRHLLARLLHFTRLSDQLVDRRHPGLTLCYRSPLRARCLGAAPCRDRNSFELPAQWGPPRTEQSAQSEIAPTTPSPSGKRYDATEDRSFQANQLKAAARSPRSCIRIR